MGVLKELDGLKKHNNPDIGTKARRAAIYISRNIDKIHWDIKEREGTVDEQLIDITNENEGTLITNDVYLKVQATLQEVPNNGFSIKSNYDGVYYWDVDLNSDEDNQKLNNIYESNTPPIDMIENQYLIIQNKETGETIEIYRYSEGSLRKVGYGKIKNNYIGTITPRNSEQRCLFDALKNKNISIIYAGGKFGTGKSLLLNNFALEELEKGNIDKIVYVPNNAYVANTIDQGALPGEILEKTIGQLGPLNDLIGIDRIKQMLAYNQLEVVPMGYIRGRSFNNSIVIVNEAQNLTEDHIKLLIARCGDGTRIFFDGDIKQVDSQLFKNKNGLKLLLKLSESKIFSKIFSAVILKKVERSQVAQAADYLDEIS